MNIYRADHASGASCFVVAKSSLKAWRKARDAFRYPPSPKGKYIISHETASDFVMKMVGKCLHEEATVVTGYYQPKDYP